MENIYALIVAGGKGLRMASGIRKQYIELAGVPILAHTLKIFDDFQKIHHIILVVPEDDIDYCANEILFKYGFKEKVTLVSGGIERQNSVMNGLSKICSLSLSLKDSVVLIHDAVRPFVDHEIISRVIRDASRYGASIPVIPVVDTLKRGDGHGYVSSLDGTVNRQELYQAQTPQAFDLKLILEAHQNALKNGFLGTDDASLVEKINKKVSMVPGSKKNIKITTPEDIAFARYIISGA
ncbi:MAG: 2-C-methyl-D-erythritol 4-phosphate cytidylyltransferase [Desulfamplus sp.]|nr:2-C-methyl-D-erythritol 4-phosphate cytidylyltransferase [Desulfamplus sp.]